MNSVSLKPEQDHPGEALACRRSSHVLAGVLLLLFLVVLVRTAWLCDDAFITIRTADNFVQGHGLTWNVMERVQTYTHPLWLGVIVGLHVCTDQLFYAVIMVSVTISIAAALVVWRVARTPIAACLALAILLFSRAFVDFSTSGLENPLTHLLLALFFLTYVNRREGAPRLGRLYLLAGLGVLTRLDIVLLYAPVLVAASWRRPRRCVLGALAAGVAPLLAWLAFASFYYGTPLPSTAYAKLLPAEIPAGDLFAQGLRYLLDSLRRDPLTLTATAAGVLLCLRRAARPLAPFAVGILLYLGYVLKIGGDFMTGRFFTAPLLVGVLILARVWPPQARPRLAAALTAVAVALLGFVTPHPTVLSGSDYHEGGIPENGVVNERGHYYQDMGLLCPNRKHGKVDPTATPWGRESDRAHPMRVVVNAHCGVAGYLVGPNVHILDNILCDPLAVRLPLKNPRRWWIGHFYRIIPRGYLEALAWNDPERIEDPALRDYYRKVHFVTRGPLWSLKRLGTAARLFLGGYDHLKAGCTSEAFARRGPVCARLSALRPDPAPPATWADERARVIDERGLEIRLDTPSRARRLSVHLDSLDVYLFVFKLGETELAMVPVQTRITTANRMERYEVEIPEIRTSPGFNTIFIRGVQTLDGMYAAGGLTLE